MANLMSFNVDEAINTAAKLDSYATEVQRINGETGQIIQLDSWQGEAQEGFIQQYQELLPYLNKYVEFMSGMATQLRNTADAYVEQDMGMKKQFGLS